MSKTTEQAARKRLEYLRQELRAERISYGELSELQSLREYIDSGDAELLEAAGVQEGRTQSGDYACPKCGQGDSFEVSAETFRMVTINGKTSDVVNDPGGDVEWDDESAMRCIECGHEALAGDFETGEPMLKKQGPAVTEI